ncbi:MULTISPECIES: AAA family ATPase [unclassified Pseudonocardia]|uniref:AAA family ATPase n=1 Tax=unclassified Pseudonocardia TaxID=2619320 RepID=UPI00094B74EA|nr:AAA family ATPase [Pseudonocardia sp. Ae707_Ps1]OLM20006.1 hypothetical protein Ae707Ps1_4265 [Pseudonocardia sp. Ae707_Ps1]
MRLISARIQGYGRLVDTKINLDSKVIAIVGPNEAGKTTLLDALAYINSGDSVPPTQRSRAGQVTDQTRIVTLDFSLDTIDFEALSDLDLHELPTRAEIARTASSANVTVKVTPRAIKSIAPLQAALTTLRNRHTQKTLDRWIAPETAYSDPDPDTARNYRTELQVVIDAVEAAVAEPGTPIAEEPAELAESLRSATLPDGERLRVALGLVTMWARRKAPDAAVRDRIWNRAPAFILFSEEDRSIRSSYDFDEQLATTPPAALENLAGMASLNLTELHDLIAFGDIARRRTKIVQANKRMDEIFEASWRQSRLSVHFDVDGDKLRIELMENGADVTVFDERSAGLRMFVALIAFLKIHGSSQPPILLIDEAENHLHIDAQADLVNMFASQEHAIKVIYSTHSPACLPTDLGTGIRTVVPRNGSQISDVRNSFWQGAAGYSPPMLAMGAAAAAFTPARNVVLAEGATEMILLPTLLRSAVGMADLPYQIAPGLSEVPHDFLPELDLEAARVAYLVDSDDGGARIKKALLAAGIPERVIIDLGLPGIENAVAPASFRAAVLALVGECNPNIRGKSLEAAPQFEAVNAGPMAAAAQIWIEQQGLKAPSKVALANWLVENGEATPSPDGVDALVALHERVTSALRVSRGEPSKRSTLD